MLVLLLHAFLQDFLQFPCGYLFTLLVFKSFGEEILERENAEMRLYVFAVHHSGYGRNVEACLGGNVLEHHRLQVRFIPVHEVVMLVVHDGLHRAEQCIVTLFQRFYKPFGGVHLLLHESGSLFLLAFGRIGRIHEQICVFLVYTYFGQ